MKINFKLLAFVNNPGSLVPTYAKASVGKPAYAKASVGKPAYARASAGKLAVA